IERQLHLIRQGHGRSGPNPEYVLSTVDALEKLGLFDRELHLLAQRLRGPHEREPVVQTSL
ncbi:MAG TPA: gamma-glutamylcyclotransferase, partial [Xanthobacteraceae bacterium]|nr:gamma-glutamylcyclotransferase [Xanthobacteraceae bacterium]